MKKKVAFITGITGMVGSHLAEYIYNNTDWDIIGMIRWRSALNNLSGLIDDINKKRNSIYLIENLGVIRSNNMINPYNENY